MTKEQVNWRKCPVKTAGTRWGRDLRPALLPSRYLFPSPISVYQRSSAVPSCPGLRLLGALRGSSPPSSLATQRRRAPGRGLAGKQHCDAIHPKIDHSAVRQNTDEHGWPENDPWTSVKSVVSGSCCLRGNQETETTRDAAREGGVAGDGGSRGLTRSAWTHARAQPCGEAASGPRVGG